MTDPQELRIADHTYDLPAERIAQEPLADRDASRLLVFRDGAITDDHFRSIGDHLPRGTLLVVNDTRVVKARLAFWKPTGARIECMVLEPDGGRPMEQALADRGSSRWWCMVGNAKRWREGALQRTTDDAVLSATRLGIQEGEHLIEFTWSGQQTFAEVLALHGFVPLPPYVDREATANDEQRYNTVFAEREGSVAAPTASLHFTRTLLADLEERGISRTRVTLHVGAGTFLPVSSERMAGHVMHREQVEVSRGTIEALMAAHGRSPLVPLGTTALRTIESLAWFGDDLLENPDLDGFQVQQWRPYQNAARNTGEALKAVLGWMEQRGLDHLRGATSLLIAPGYPFRLATGLVTNFHQPGSTLLLLVAAFLGPGWRKVYDHALAKDYRFLSYGDGSLLWLPTSSNDPY